MEKIYCETCNSLHKWWCSGLEGGGHYVYECHHKNNTKLESYDTFLDNKNNEKIYVKHPKEINKNNNCIYYEEKNYDSIVSICFKIGITVGIIGFILILIFS